MLAEGGDHNRIPDTLQALIAARIDHLAPDAKALLQRAAVIGRVFWKGAIKHVAPNLEVEALLDDLLLREFVLREERSSISGETAFRFKHMLIREVAYAGLSKQARAQQHARFAEWLKERAGEELLEIRAHHLDHATQLLAELDGAPPADLTSEAADALTGAGKRALNREQYKSARRQLVRAVELEPTLRRRYYAARAVWRLGDLTAVRVEMEKVRAQAEAEGDALMEALALTALGDAALRQIRRHARAQELIDRALELQKDETDVDAHFDSLMVTRRDRRDARVDGRGRAVHRAELRGRARRRPQGPPDDRLAGAGPGAHRPARARQGRTPHPQGARAGRRERQPSRARAGEAHPRLPLSHAEASTTLPRRRTRRRASSSRRSATPRCSRTRSSRMADVAFEKGDLKRSEKLLRESIRLLAPLGQHRELAESQAELARVLAEQGKIDEAERFVGEAQEYLPSAEPQLRLFIVLALAAVRTAQERQDEAEELFVEALAITDEVDFTALEAEVLRRIVRFLDESGQNGKAAPYEERLAVLVPAESTAEIA